MQQSRESFWMNGSGSIDSSFGLISLQDEEVKQKPKIVDGNYLLLNIAFTDQTINELSLIVNQHILVIELKQLIAKERGIKVEKIGIHNPERPTQYLKSSTPISKTLGSARNKRKMSMPTRNLRVSIFEKPNKLRIVESKEQTKQSPGRIYFIDIYLGETVSKLKQLLEMTYGIQVEEQILVLRGNVMKDELTLIDYDFKQDDDLRNSIGGHTKFSTMHSWIARQKLRSRSTSICSTGFNSPAINTHSNRKSTTTGRGKPPDDIYLYIKKVEGTQVSIGMDFTFNNIKDIKKFRWDSEAPDFREITDGLSFFYYCLNPVCKLFNQLFVFNRGTIYIYIYTYRFWALLP